jgi:NADPH-dependent curcumin reductase CurA
VIGIVGSEEKVNYLLNEVAFDGALNYKTELTPAKLEELGPTGVDCYFDNVGGTVTAEVLKLMNTFGRVALCGLISQYNRAEPAATPEIDPLGLILGKQLHVEGFLFTQFQSRWRDGLTQIAGWMTEGKLKPRETIIEGSKTHR